MRVLSLFDGMSCARIALERAGINVTSYYASEVDKYAVKVAQANYPDTVQLGSVTDVMWPETFEKLPIDLLIGGSPCQGFSFAGKQLNFEDPRSALFWEYVRLLKECKPRYFLLENVRMNQRSQDVITEALGAKPIPINSSLVSAQNRKRLYWTNISFDTPADKNIDLQNVIEGGFVDRKKSHCIDANYWKGGNLKSYFEKHRRQLVFDHDSFTGLYRKLTPVEVERLQTVPDNYTAHVSNTQRYKMLGNGFTVDVIAQILRGIPALTCTKSQS